MLEIAGFVVAAASLAWAFFIWIDPEIRRVRRALRDEEPNLEIAVTSTGGPAHLLITIRNRGSGEAHDLVFSATGINDMWRRQALAPGEETTAQIGLPDDAPVRSIELANPVAELRFGNRFGHPFVATVTLTQAQRDDRLYNIGSRPELRVTRPRLSRWALWKLRQEL